METLIHEINNKKYIAIEMLVTSDDPCNQLDYFIEKVIGAIEIGVKEYKHEQGLFTETKSAIVKLLVPLDKLNEFKEKWQLIKAGQYFPRTF